MLRLPAEGWPSWVDMDGRPRTMSALGVHVLARCGCVVVFCKRHDYLWRGRVCCAYVRWRPIYVKVVRRCTPARQQVRRSPQESSLSSYRPSTIDNWLMRVSIASICWRLFLHCVSKNIPDIFDCNLKTNYQILIIFGMIIPDTACHQITIQFPTSPNFFCFCTTWGNHNLQNITFLSNAIWLLN